MKLVILFLVTLTVCGVLSSPFFYLYSPRQHQYYPGLGETNPSYPALKVIVYTISDDTNLDANNKESNLNPLEPDTKIGSQSPPHVKTNPNVHIDKNIIENSNKDSNDEGERSGTGNNKKNDAEWL